MTLTLLWGDGSDAQSFLCAPRLAAVNFYATRLQRASSRLIEFKQYLEPDHIRPKPYLQFLDPKRKTLRR